MSRKFAEINLVIHYPKMPDGWRLLIGRRIILARLMESQRRGERVSLNYELSKVTTKDALAAYQEELDRHLNDHPNKMPSRKK